MRSFLHRILPQGVILGFMVLAIDSCTHDKEIITEENPGVTPLNPEYYAGGEGTLFIEDETAFLHPNSILAPDHLDLFQQGQELFHQEFSPLNSGEFDGLGPLFIQNSCNGCHHGNGRSQPPMDENDVLSGMLIRMSISGQNENGGPLGVPGFGGQLQTQCINGGEFEGRYFVEYFPEIVTYGDGSTTTIYQPYITLTNTYDVLPPDILKSARNASPLYGLGLLEAVTNEEIISRVDEADQDGDYISGRVNHVWDALTQSMQIGRFGWKASNVSILQQSAEAFQQDMGITSAVLFPEENCYGQSNCSEGIGTEPDITLEQAELISLFVRGLAVPAPRNLEDPIVQQGRSLFYAANCTGCHTPQLQTGSSPWPELSGQTIYPYTDLLIHDLGEVLADGRPDYEASANEWRTPPLWGIGLTKLVNPDARFLHDGRASTLEEAILWHGGEALWARNYFKAMTAEERAALISFLEAL